MGDNEEERRLRLIVAAANCAILAVKTYLNRQRKRKRNNIPREPVVNREACRSAHMQRILDGSVSSCVDYLRMRKMPFLKLTKLVRELGLLSDTLHVSVEEQLAMFLNIVGHKTKNRVARVEFIRSGETISRYFNEVLRAMFALRDRFMKQPTGSTPPEIVNNPDWYPYFEDCIGMIDGTHVDATVPPTIMARFRGRNGVTQNVLAACTPDKLFTYVLAGWEGSVNDYTVLQDALSLPPPHGIRVLEGKFYLCDAGYATEHGFIAPYCGTQYHRKEHAMRTPNNRRELFNLRHSSLRTKIEVAFGILKNRFKILSATKHHPFPTQVDVVLVCAILHNYIAMMDPSDDILNESIESIVGGGELADEDMQDTVEFDVNQTQAQLRENRLEWQARRDQIAWDMWVDHCNLCCGGNTAESTD